MSDSTSINALIAGQHNASVIDSLANPPQINVLGSITRAADAAKSVMGIRALQAHQAWNDALATATGPTGVVDYPAALKAFSGSPDATYGMQEAASGASGLQNDQVTRGHYHLGILQGLFGGIDENMPPAQLRAELNATLDRAKALGLSPTDVENDRAKIPADDAALPGYVRQFRFSLSSGADQAGYGGGAGGMNAEFLGRPYTYTDEKNVVHNTTIGGYLQKMGTLPPGVSMPAPATPPASAPASGRAAATAPVVGSAPAAAPKAPPVPIPTAYPGGAPAAAAAAPALPPVVQAPATPPSTTLSLPSITASPTAAVPSSSAPAAPSATPATAPPAPNYGGPPAAGAGAPGAVAAPPPAPRASLGSDLGHLAAALNPISTAEAAPYPAVKEIPGPAAGTAEAAKKEAEAAAGMGNSLMARADQVPQNKANYALMLSDLAKLNSMGSGADKEKAVNSFVQRWTGSGLTMTADQIAAGDSFAKLANIAVAQQLAAIGSTDARQQLFMGANPSLDLSKLGNTRILHMLQGNEDAINAKANAWREWRGSGKGAETYLEFQNDFNHHFDPRVFQQQYMGPDEINDLRRSMTLPNGQPTGAGKKFLEDVQWARDHNWISKPEAAASPPAVSRFAAVPPPAANLLQPPAA